MGWHIVPTAHARKRMRLRKISIEQIAEDLNQIGCITGGVVALVNTNQHRASVLLVSSFSKHAKVITVLNQPDPVFCNVQKVYRL